MGCCLQNREDPNNRDKSNVLVDIKGKISTNLISKYAFSHNTTPNNNIHQESKFDNAKTYFNKGGNSLNTHHNVSGNIENSPGNSLTIDNSNFNTNNNNAGLFKVNKKGSNIILANPSTMQEKEKKDKENNEVNEKTKAEENSNQNEEGGEKIVKIPRVEFHISNSKNQDEKSMCVITPNSINDQVKKLGEKFYFGKDDPKANKKNHYNFNDDSIGVRQFEIAFNSEKGKFFLVDNKRGTGLFIKIKQKILVDHDMIVSFCASHMILQLEGENEKKTKSIKIRFLQGPHQNQDWIFNPTEKKIVRIGRSKSAEIVYKDDSVSRIQCTLVYENNNWNLYDGYLDNGNKGSTNGLWLLASSKVEVINDMILKTGNTTIKVTLIEQ